MSKRVLVASTIGAVAKVLEAYVKIMADRLPILSREKFARGQLIDGKYEVLMLELNFIEGEHRDLIARLRSKKQLQDLFVVIYAPSEMSKEEQVRANGVNAVLTAPFTDSKIVSLFKRAFPFP